MILVNKQMYASDNEHQRMFIYPNMIKKTIDEYKVYYYEHFKNKPDSGGYKLPVSVRITIKDNQPLYIKLW